jgi:hypothetical protein
MSTSSDKNCTMQSDTKQTSNHVLQSEFQFRVLRTKVAQKVSDHKPQEDIRTVQKSKSKLAKNFEKPPQFVQVRKCSLTRTLLRSFETIFGFVATSGALYSSKISSNYFMRCMPYYSVTKFPRVVRANPTIMQAKAPLSQVQHRCKLQLLGLKKRHILV